MLKNGYQEALLTMPTPTHRTVKQAGVQKPVARVLLDSPIPHLDHLFDYYVPPELDQSAQVGTCVYVRFNGTKMRGWVWQREKTTTHLGRLSPLVRVVSDLPVVSAEIQRLVEVLAARTAGTCADIMRLAVPSRHARAERAERERQITLPAPTHLPTLAASGWQIYAGGSDFYTALAQGWAPRYIWSALPGRSGIVKSWQFLLAQAVKAVLTNDKGALILTATTVQAEALAKQLRQELGNEPVVVLASEHSEAQRYRNFLALRLGHARVAVGARSAAYAPVTRLGLAVIWDDGDDNFNESRAPYAHARTVLAVRASLEKSALLIAGYARTVEAQSYIKQGWAKEIAAPRALVRTAIARIDVPGKPELEAEGDSGRGRIPSLAHRALRRALAQGPVLVQVPRGGYAPMVACNSCRAPAQCQFCGGVLEMNRNKKISCRWCARVALHWKCRSCGGTKLRMVAVGTTRTAEELGRAFPGIPVTVSGLRSDHGIIKTVDSQPRLVVATPGAEPTASSGYPLVVILDSAALSGRAQLGASIKALRLWSAAAVLARATGRIILLGGADKAVSGAFLRWDQGGFARRELTEREELFLPPAVRCARIDGSLTAVEAVLEKAQRCNWEVLGPVEITPTDAHEAEALPASGKASLAEDVQFRALIRVPLSKGHELATTLRLYTRQASVHRAEHVRIELDPSILW